MAMTLVSTTTVGSGGAASIEFTGIAGTGKDLLLLVSGRSTDAASNGIPIRLALNSDTTNANYTGRALYGEGSGTPTSFTLGSREIADVPISTQTANTFSNNLIYLSNYAGSTNKSFSVDSVTENNGTSYRARILAGLWSNTAAITSITLSLGTGNFAQHTTASLYIVS